MRFLYMYTREAHANPANAPCGSTEDLGWEHPSSETRSMEQRAQRVRWLKDQFGLDYPFLIDDMDNTVRNTYFGGGFYMAWVIDCDGQVLVHEPWAWATQETQWCGLPLPNMNRMEAFLDSYLAKPSACYRGVEQPVFSVVVPVVAHLKGRDGSRWISGMSLANPSNEIVTAELTLLLSTVAKAATSVVKTISLNPGTSQVLDDVLPDLFATTGIGALRIDADHDLVVASRIMNDRNGAATGQVVPPIRSTQAITGDQVAHLFNLEESVHARTNLGFVNLSENQVTVEVIAFSASGPELGRRTIKVQGHDLAQLNRLLERFGATSEIGARAEVRCLSTDCRLVTFASVVNNSSGDARFVTPSLNTWAVDSLVALAATDIDEHGQQRHSELYLYNNRDQPTTAMIEARSATDNLDVDRFELELPPFSARVIEDPLTMFNLSSIDATLKITGEASQGLVASSRIVLEGSPFGDLEHSIPAFDVTGDGVIRFDRRGHLLQLEQTGPDGRSTDLRLVNVRASLAEADLRFFATDGSELGHLIRTIGGFAVLKLENVLTEIGADGQTGVRVEIRTDGRLLAATITRDHSSGDRLYQSAWVEMDVSFE